MWIVGAPRIDKVEIPRDATTEGADQSLTVCVDITPSDAVPLAQADAANLLAGFWDRVYTEFNIAKHLTGIPKPTESGVRAGMGKTKERCVKSPESLSTKTLLHQIIQKLPL